MIEVINWSQVTDLVRICHNIRVLYIFMFYFYIPNQEGQSPLLVHKITAYTLRAAITVYVVSTWPSANKITCTSTSFAVECPCQILKCCYQNNISKFTHVLYRHASKLNSSFNSANIYILLRTLLEFATRSVNSYFMLVWITWILQWITRFLGSEL